MIWRAVFKKNIH